MNPAGWYDDPGDPTQVRWWDGAAWTASVRPKIASEVMPSGAGGTGLPHRPKKPFYRRTWVLVTAGAIVFFGAIGALGSGGDDDAAAPRAGGSSPTSAEPLAKKDTVEVPDVTGMNVEEAIADLTDAGLTYGTIGENGQVDLQSPSAGVEVLPGTQIMLTVVDHEAQKAAEEAAAAEAAAAAAAAEAAKGTVSQQNAYRSAVSYLAMTAFSRAGIIDQLTSEYGEGYPPEDAEFAIARLEAEGGVDWNAEAAEAAASYLEMTAFSRQGLIDQLTSQYGEQFTREQAEYGVSTTGL